MQWWKSDRVFAPVVFLAVFCLMFGMLYVAGRYLVPSPEQQEKVAEVSVLRADRGEGTTVIVEIYERRGLGLLVNREKDLFCWTASYLVRDIGFGGQAVFRCTAADGTDMALRGVVILYKEEEGVALLRFAVPEGKVVDYPSVFFAFEKPKEGEDIYHVAARPDRTHVRVGGRVMSVDHLYAGMPYDIVSCDIVSGSGGGGVFDTEDSCLGIVSVGRPGRILIVPARRVHALAEQKGIPWASDPSIPMP